MPNYGDAPAIATARDALDRQTVSELKKLASVVTSARKPIRKPELVDLILEHLESEKLKATWDRLDETQKTAVAETVHFWGGTFHADRFQAKYGKSPIWGSGGGYEWERKPSLLCAFIYRTTMPEDLRQRLKAFVPVPRAMTLKSDDTTPEICPRQWKEYDSETRKYEFVVEEIPVVVAEMERAAQHDLQAMLRLVQTGKIAVSDKTLLATAPSIKAITALLHGGDYYPDDPDEEEDLRPGPIKAFAWPLLLQAGKLAELSGKRLVLTKAGQKALSSRPADTLKNLWDGWMGTTILDEMRRTEAIKGQTGKGKAGMTPVAGRRTVIRKALATCPLNRWVTVDDFFRYMQAANFAFEVTEDEWSLYLAEHYYGHLGQGEDSWVILQMRYALCLLFEYAATLGILDVAYTKPDEGPADYTGLWGADDLPFLSRYDGLSHFRLNSLGAYCLGVEENYTPVPLEQRPVLRALPNLDVVAAGDEVPASDILVLDIFTRRVSEGVWRLDAWKLLGVMEEGHTVAELQEFLQARSSDELPGTVQQFLRDFSERSQRLIDQGTARLVECTDPALLLLILNDPKTKSHCLPAGDRHFVIRGGSEAPFRSALRQLGYVLPAGT
ncbi:MAG: helicase-associated domain-containing protein [Armatimonadota bacterium]|nr:helicase-associated domain-containing protein [Armatimonadota bacterium]